MRGNKPQISPDSLLAGPNRGTAHLYRRQVKEAGVPESIDAAGAARVLPALLPKCQTAIFHSSGTCS
jgi:hypothetical protein